MATDGTKKYRVTLTPEERAELEGMLGRGSAAAAKPTHARILLKADQAEGGPGWSDGRIVEALDVGRATVARVRERFVEPGLKPDPVNRGEWQVLPVMCQIVQELPRPLLVVGCHGPPIERIGKVIDGSVEVRREPVGLVKIGSRLWQRRGQRGGPSAKIGSDRCLPVLQFFSFGVKRLVSLLQVRCVLGVQVL